MTKLLFVLSPILTCLLPNLIQAKDHPLKYIDREDAQQIAISAIHAKLDYPNQLAIMENLTREEVFGWVFFCQSKEYIKSQNSNDMIVGLGPIAVNKTDKTAHFLPSGPPERMIENYKQQWLKARPKNAF